MATSKAKLQAITNRVRKVWGDEAIEESSGNEDWLYRIKSPHSKTRIQLHGSPSDVNWEAVVWRQLNRAGFAVDEKNYLEKQEADRIERIALDREKAAKKLVTTPTLVSGDLLTRAGGELVAQPGEFSWVLGKHEFPQFRRSLVGPDLAQVILANHNDHNRPIREGRVEYWADVMKNGRWRYTHQGIAFDVEGNLQDGQHRLAACVKADFIMDIGVSVGMPVENFKVVDIGGLRTGADVAHIAGYTQHTNTVSQAARWLWLYRTYGGDLRLGVRAKMSNEALVGAISKYGQPLLDAVEQVHIYKKSRICPPINNGVFAAGLVLMHESDRTEGQHYVDRFLDGFVSGTGLIPQDPRDALRRFCSNMRGNARVRVTSDVQFGVLIKAWNDYVYGNTRQFLQLRTDEAFPTMKAVA